MLEDRAGRVVEIEVKATASLRPGVDRTLRRLRDGLGDRFRAGVVIYTGADTIPFGEPLWAVPVSGLWTGARGR